MTDPHADDGPVLATLPNGVRLLVLPAPHLHTASVSVFLRCGSTHERARESGISHVVEHMVFKGAAGRDAHRLNLDAERLGAEVNAHTDKDHTAFHMRGRAGDAARFVHMLADLVCRADFPDEEIQRERAVLLHEMTEVEDDPMASAYQLFDRACYGLHAAAQPVIGSRRNVERFTRAELVDWVARRYTGANTVVAAIGPLDPDALVQATERAFAGMPAGMPAEAVAPAWRGGVRTRRMAGSQQTHLVLGFPVPALAEADVASELAAVLFGEGMSSPLMAQLRERRALAYYASCAVDRFAHAGQVAIEVSIAPESLDEALSELATLLAAMAGPTARGELARARHQLAVRLLREREGATRRLEAAALDLLFRGSLRPPAQRLAEAEAVTAAQVRAAFRRMLAAPPALAITGRIVRAAGSRAAAALAPLDAFSGD